MNPYRRLSHSLPGLQINVNVDREILNHRLLVHPHIIRFHEVCGFCCDTPECMYVVQSAAVDSGRSIHRKDIATHKSSRVCSHCRCLSRQTSW